MKSLWRPITDSRSWKKMRKEGLDRSHHRFSVHCKASMFIANQKRNCQQVSSHSAPTTPVFSWNRFSSSTNSVITNSVITTDLSARPAGYVKSLIHSLRNLHLSQFDCLRIFPVVLPGGPGYLMDESQGCDRFYNRWPQARLNS